MNKPRIAILGATGVVGAQMIECLEERDFPVGELIALASARSAGKTLRFRDQEITVREACPEAFEDIDIVLGAAEDNIARALLPEAVARGAVCIDNSHAFRLDEDVPLVIPEINASDIPNNHGIIANPNCATIIGLVPLWPLHQEAGLKRLVVSTYQAASGAGKPGLDELVRETKAVVAGEDIDDSTPFQHQLVYNLIPQIGSFNELGYSSEEMKMQNEGRKIMHLPDLRVNCCCVRVPVMRSHSESIMAEFERPLSPERAREILSSALGVQVVDEPNESVYPMPIETSDQDLIFVGRIRRDISAPDGVHSLSLWCCGDQIRKGAATNAVQIAEYLL